jgi:hypothetical protein
MAKGRRHAEVIVVAHLNLITSITTDRCRLNVPEGACCSHRCGGGCLEMELSRVSLFGGAIAPAE